MQYARTFEMVDEGNRTEYFLIYATHSLDGLKAIKSAMWNVDPSGSFQFSDATVSSQLTLFSPEPNYAQLKAMILTKFAGADVSVESLEEFVIVETPFREAHYKRQILSPMEKNSELTVVRSSRQKVLTYPAGTVIRFAAD